jgi:hypothetical protein
MKIILIIFLILILIRLYKIKNKENMTQDDLISSITTAYNNNKNDLRTFNNIIVTNDISSNIIGDISGNIDGYINSGYMYSPSQNYLLALQDDGDLVVYSITNNRVDKPIWFSKQTVPNNSNDISYVNNIMLKGGELYDAYSKFKFFINDIGIPVALDTTTTPNKVWAMIPTYY